LPKISENNKVEENGWNSFNQATGQKLEILKFYKYNPDIVKSHKPAITHTGQSRVLKLKAELPFYMLSFPVPSLKTRERTFQLTLSLYKNKRKDLPMNIIPISKQKRKDLPMSIIPISKQKRKEVFV
jgi:hypothetical protein